MIISTTRLPLHRTHVGRVICDPKHALTENKVKLWQMGQILRDRVILGMSLPLIVQNLLPVFFHGCLRIIVFLVVLDVRLGIVVFGIKALRRVPPIVCKEKSLEKCPQHIYNIIHSSHTLQCKFGRLSSG